MKTILVAEDNDSNYILMTYILRRSYQYLRAKNGREAIELVEKGGIDLVLMDVPPINIVSDPLALSSQCAGALFVVRQEFSDHREIRRQIEVAVVNRDLLNLAHIRTSIRHAASSALMPRPPLL